MVERTRTTRCSAFDEKVKAIVTDVKDCYERGQPVLVGTTSIGLELLSQHFTKERLPRAERQAARARGRDRRAGRHVEGNHDRDQHGGPWHGQAGAA